jgi:feruloyl esterase
MTICKMVLGLDQLFGDGCGAPEEIRHCLNKTGQVGSSGSFALGYPEKLAGCAGCGIQGMTLKSNAITDAFYGKAPKSSYFQGCSTGSRQDFAEVQRSPADYDGIILLN